MRHGRPRWCCAAALIVLVAASCASGKSAADAAFAGTCGPARPLDANLVVDSDVYGGAQRVRVHVTPCRSRVPLAVVYLLHGAGADETQWPDVDVNRLADALVASGRIAPLVLVFPNAAPAYRCGSGCGAVLLRHLLDEVEPAVAKVAALDPARRAIGGISRGAGLALAAAAERPGAFLALGAHSPAVGRAADAVASLAGEPLRYLVDVGVDDPLARPAAALSDALVLGGADVRQELNAGGHDRAYWRSQVGRYLRFYADALAGVEAR